MYNALRILIHRKFNSKPRGFTLMETGSGLATTPQLLYHALTKEPTISTYMISNLEYIKASKNQIAISGLYYQIMIFKDDLSTQELT